VYPAYDRSVVYYPSSCGLRCSPSFESQCYKCTNKEICMNEHVLEYEHIIFCCQLIRLKKINIIGDFISGIIYSIVKSWNSGESSSKHIHV
jgi:hypothetical protein